MAAGLLPAAITALSISNVDVREGVLGMLGAFLYTLPDRRRPEALKELVTCKAVGRIVCIMGVGTEDGLAFGAGILALLLRGPQSSQAVLTENVASQIIRCFGRWLLEVCRVAIWWGSTNDKEH